MKVKIVEEVKRSDGLWRFACGDVLIRYDIEIEVNLIQNYVKRIMKMHKTVIHSFTHKVMLHNHIYSHQCTSQKQKLFMQPSQRSPPLLPLSFAAEWRILVHEIDVLRKNEMTGYPPVPPTSRQRLHLITLKFKVTRWGGRTRLDCVSMLWSR